MAKELPYFKFEPAEWIIGDISNMSLEHQGFFIQICCYYWLKDCKVEKQMLYNRFANEKLIKELIANGILKVENEKIIIDFLLTQIDKFRQISEARSTAGSQGGRGNKANAKQNKANAKQLPIYKRREEEIREDKSIEDRKTLFKEKLLQYQTMYSLEILEDFFNYWTEHNEKGKKMRFEMQKTWSIELRLQTWYKRSNEYKNGGNRKKTSPDPRKVAEAIARGLSS